MEPEITILTDLKLIWNKLLTNFITKLPRVSHTFLIIIQLDAAHLNEMEGVGTTLLKKFDLHLHVNVLCRHESRIRMLPNTAKKSDFRLVKSTGV